MSKLDKRRQERYDLKLPAYLQLTNIEEKPLELVTENVCSGGAYFHIDQPLPVGTKVDIELTVPIKQLAEMNIDKVLITVPGEAIRSEKDGMAIQFSKAFHILPMVS